MILSMWEQEKFDEGRSQGRSETLDAAAAFMKENGIQQ